MPDSPLLLVDTHAHLEMEDFDGDRDAVVARAGEAGIAAVVTVGTSRVDGEKAVALAAAYPAVYAAVGIHPHEAREATRETLDALGRLARRPKVVAYGEIGLDFYRNRAPRDLQIRCFGEQLDLARALGLPVVVHDREAHRETLEMLRPWQGERVVIHCFSGDVAMAKQVLDWGFFLSVDGPVTYPKAQRLVEVVRFVPLERLFLETDAPYLSPQNHRGRRNEPAYLVHTAARVAEIKGVPWDVVAETTTRAAKAFFRIP